MKQKRLFRTTTSKSRDIRDLRRRPTQVRATVRQPSWRQNVGPAWRPKPSGKLPPGFTRRSRFSLRECLTTTENGARITTLTTTFNGETVSAIPKDRRAVG